MAYILPVVYVVVSYTFFLLAGFFDNTMELQILSILLPFIMGIINLIVVLTAGRKWSRKTLLNCTLIIKYGLIPFYLLGGSITVYVTMMAPLSFAAYGFIWIGNNCIFNFWIRDSIGISSLCDFLSDKVA